MQELVLLKYGEPGSERTERSEGVQIGEDQDDKS